MMLAPHIRMSLISFNNIVLSVLVSAIGLYLAVDGRLLFGIIIIVVYESLYLYVNSLYCKRLSKSIIDICNINNKRFIPQIFFWNLVPFAIVLVISIVYSAIYVVMALYLVMTAIHLGTAVLTLKKRFPESTTTIVFLIVLAAHTLIFNYCIMLNYA
jgi:hypothetical protein